MTGEPGAVVGAERGAGAGAVPYRALVVTASNRAAAGVYADRGGPLVVAGLEASGFVVDGPRVVPDGEPVEAELRAGTAAGYDVIVTTGGTGVSPTDRTPEATRAVLDYEVPGIPEAIRAFGREKVPTAALSRGLAGVAGRTLIVNLPGSTGGVKDGLAVLEPLLGHAVAQLRGGDHPAPGTGGGPIASGDDRRESGSGRDVSPGDRRAGGESPVVSHGERRETAGENHPGSTGENRSGSTGDHSRSSGGAS